MKREFDVLIERDSEGYYVGTVPALPGCHTQAQSGRARGGAGHPHPSSQGDLSEARVSFTPTIKHSCLLQ